MSFLRGVDRQEERKEVISHIVNGGQYIDPEKVSVLVRVQEKVMMWSEWGWIVVVYPSTQTKPGEKELWSEDSTTPVRDGEWSFFFYHKGELWVGTRNRGGEEIFLLMRFDPDLVTNGENEFVCQRHKWFSICL